MHGMPPPITAPATQLHKLVFQLLAIIMLHSLFVLFVVERILFIAFCLKITPSVLQSTA